MASSADLSVLSERVQKALAADRQVLDELKRFDDEYEELQGVVRDLPEKVSHQIMVPFTDVAFFPGRLIHTNELLVLLGSDLYAQRSATQTLDIVERRRELLREKIAGAQSSVDAMDSRVAAVDAVRAADTGGGGGGGDGGGSGGGGRSRGGGGGLGCISEEDGDEDEAGTSGSGSFATRQDGRATVVEKPDGMVEITEVYDDGEALEGFDDGGGGGGAAAAAGARARAGAGGGTERELDDFIARLEALEAGETDEGPGMDTTIEEEEVEEEAEEEEEEEEEDGGFSSISSPADMLRFERWKAQQQRDGYDVGHQTREHLQHQVELQSHRDLEKEAEENAEANRRAASQAAQTFRGADDRDAAAERRHAAVKSQVTERGDWTSVGGVRERERGDGGGGSDGGGGAGGTLVESRSGGGGGGGGGGRDGGGRPMSKFKMRMMGIDPDEQEDA